MIASFDNKVHFLNFEMCVHDMPNPFPSLSSFPTATKAPSLSVVQSSSPSDTCYWIEINIVADDDLRGTPWEL